MLDLKNNETFVLETKGIGAEVSITAEFIHYIFENEEDSFYISFFSTINYDNFVAIGNVPFKLEPGRSYEMKGIIKEHVDRQTGLAERQLEIREIKVKKPQTEAETIKFIASITGRTTASYLYDEYQEKTLDILMNNPEKASKDFNGLSLEGFQLLSNDIKSALGESSQAFPFLQKYRFTRKQIEKMLGRYGEQIIGMIKRNPYMLMNNQDDLPGASFTRCDKIARDINYDLSSPYRIKGGIEHVLVLEGREGHIYYYQDKVIRHATGLLNKDNPKQISAEKVDDIIYEMVGEGRLYLDRNNKRIYLRRHYENEKLLALNLVSLLEDNEWMSRQKREELLDIYLETEGIELEVKQRQAILDLTKSPGGVGVINGGAGTGKTFTVKVLMEFMSLLYKVIEDRYPLIQLMAPTGKAAKVMKEATGRETSTIHRGLLWTPDGFQHTEANPLPGDMIIIDEASMLDTSLACSLTRAIRPGSKLVLLGDDKQLPSIGAGNVLHDIINSEHFDIITLDVIRRQTEESQIAINGRLIADMEFPKQDENTKDPEAIIKTRKTPAELLNQSLLALEYLIGKGIDIHDIQFISPGRRGLTGIYNLNKKIQEIVNVETNNYSVLNKSFIVNNQSQRLYFKVNDRVIHTVNTSDLEWVVKDEFGDYIKDDKEARDESALITNGEIGRIVDIYQESYITQSRRKQKRDIIIVEFEDGLLKYQGNEKRYLDHAYAMTIHKSQGSQWNSVVQLMTNEHYIMLDNSLLYTGYTRAEENQILLVQPHALSKAIKNRKSFDRRTTLPEFVEAEVNYTP